MISSRLKLFIIISLSLVAIALAYVFAKQLPFCKNKTTANVLERTLAIIKPDAVAAGNAKNIITAIKDYGFNIVAQKELTLDQNTAEQFYAVHKDKPFFADLIKYITSGPIIVLVLEREDAVAAWRTLMGSTNPLHAQDNTIRKLYGTDIQRNAVHGSDSVENAKEEIKTFFPELQ